MRNNLLLLIAYVLNISAMFRRVKNAEGFGYREMMVAVDARDAWRLGLQWLSDLGHYQLASARLSCETWSRTHEAEHRERELLRSSQARRNKPTMSACMKKATIMYVELDSPSPAEGVGRNRCCRP